jgi:hypothetical protein
VLGSWRGNDSHVQILPPPAGAPLAPQEIAYHPFILELPIKESDFWPLTSYRRLREHRRFTLLLNLLLTGGTSFQPRRSNHFWANVRHDDGTAEIRWVQEFYFAPLNNPVNDGLSLPAAEPIVEINPDQYYDRIGLDGKGLRVPTDLDELICRYVNLSSTNREKFDRAGFWMDLSSRQWTISFSASFASVVSAVEALTDRGTTHRVHCEQCNGYSQHEVPGATERFRAFFEQYAPGASLRKRRTEIYTLRSGILHGSNLMQLDQDRDFGWDPPGWNERELADELGSLTRLAIRNWLRDPPPARRLPGKLSIGSARSTKG